MGSQCKSYNFFESILNLLAKVEVRDDVAVLFLENGMDSEWRVDMNAKTGTYKGGFNEQGGKKTVFNMLRNYTSA